MTLFNEGCLNNYYEARLDQIGIDLFGFGIQLYEAYGPVRSLFTELSSIESDAEI